MQIRDGQAGNALKRLSEMDGPSDAEQVVLTTFTFDYASISKCMSAAQNT